MVKLISYDIIFMEILYIRGGKLDKKLINYTRHKKIIISLMICLSFTLISCSNSNNKNNSNDNTSKIESSTNTDNSNNNKENKEKDNSTNNSTDNYSKFTKIKLGEKVVNDGLIEYSFDSLKIVDELWPSGESPYTYKQDMPGQKFFAIKGTIKNLSGNEIDLSNIMLKNVFNETYGYQGFVEIEDGNGQSFNVPCVTPLSTATFYIVFEIPDEMANSFEECKVLLGYDNLVDYIYYEEDCTKFYQLDLTKGDITN